MNSVLNLKKGQKLEYSKELAPNTFATIVKVDSKNNSFSVTGNQFDKPVVTQEELLKGLDLFMNYFLLPKEALKIIDKYDDYDGDEYEMCRKMEKDFKKIGYTFDWYLDGEPYNLRLIKKKKI